MGAMFLLIAVLALAFMSHAAGRRGRRRWGGGWDHGLSSGARGYGGAGDPAEGMALRRALEAQQAYVETLETRVLQLEERLDFTEKLLMGRRDPDPPA